MAHEFIARKGVISSGSVNVYGSVTASYFVGDGSKLTNISTTSALSSSLNIDTYSFVGNGTTTNYILSRSYEAQSVFVSVEGMTLTNNLDYTLSAQTASFIIAPPTQSNILIRAFINLAGNVTGSFSGSFIGNGWGLQNVTAITANTASFVEYSAIANKPTLVSSSTQVTALLPVGTISSSGQISYIGLSNIPSGIISSSAQLPSGIISSSTQLPSGTISSSDQVQLVSVTGTTFSSSNFTFPQNLTVNGIVTAREFYTQVVSSSIIYQSGSTKFGDSDDDVMSVTGSINISGSMIISSSGRVGIGTMSPGTTLHVQGAISASSVTSSGDIRIFGLRVGRGGGGFSQNAALGVNALLSNTSGTSNIAIGGSAMQSNTTGQENIAIGTQALISNISGSSNTAIGRNALYYNTANGNIAIGSNTLFSNTIGTSNIGIGAMGANVIGNNNVVIGGLNSSVSSSFNTVVGSSALGNFNRTADVNGYNTAIGYLSMNTTTTGNYNTAIGYNSGYHISTGAKNTILGSFTGAQDSLDIITSNNNIVLSDGDGNARLYYDGTSNFWAFRNGGSERVRITSTGNVGIGTSSPTGILQTAGSGNQTVYFTHTDNVPGRTVTLRLGSDNTTYINRSTFIQAIQGSGIDNYALAFGTTSATDASAQTRMFISTTGHVLIGTTNADVGGTVTGSAFRPDGQLLVSNNKTGSIDSYSYYGDRRGTNNTGPVYTLAMGGYLKADIGVAGTNASTDDGVITFNTIAGNATRTERMRIRYDGNVGIGTTSPTTKLEISDIAPVLRVSGLDGSKPQLQISSVGVVNWALRANFNNASDFTIYQDSTQRMQIDSSGRLLVGYTINQDGAALQVDANSVSSTVYSARIVNSSTSTTAYNVMRFIQGAVGSATGMIGTGGSATANVGFQNTFVVGTQTSHALVFMTNDAERARVTTGGYTKASNTGTYSNATGEWHEFTNNSANFAALTVYSSNASFVGDAILYCQADRNTTNNTFYALSYYNAGAAAYKFRVADSGNVTNTNGIYGTISDAKYKTNIVDAGSQWADIKAIRFRKFKMTNDPSGLMQLGVVAQELEQVSPGLVEEHVDRDADGNDLDTTTKSVKTSILLMKAAVALQEAMSRIEVLEQEIRQLKGS